MFSCHSFDVVLLILALFAQKWCQECKVDTNNFLHIPLEVKSGLKCYLSAKRTGRFLSIIDGKCIHTDVKLLSVKPGRKKNCLIFDQFSSLFLLNGFLVDCLFFYCYKYSVLGFIRAWINWSWQISTTFSTKYLLIAYLKSYHQSRLWLWPL